MTRAPILDPTETYIFSIYGAVTSGDIWKFGLYQRQTKQIQKDINTYAAPTDLDRILSILFGVTLNIPADGAN